MPVSISRGLVWHNGHVDEDVLTGHVFSTLRYIASARRAFLSQLAQLNSFPADSFVDDQGITFEPWPAWDVPADQQAAFGRIQNAKGRAAEGSLDAPKGTIVPDVVVSPTSTVLGAESRHFKRLRGC